MKAFILDRYGSADRVRAGEMPDPEVREDDVLVQVLAAGVSLLDSKIRNGEFELRANGGQLTEIASLIDDGIIRPVLDRVFPFASTKEAMAYVEAGRAKGKVVVSLK